MKIAIVGAGISGASALKAIIDHPNFSKNDQIHLFEPRAKVGVGLPYGADDDSIMLNISPDLLSMVDENPLDFTQWLEENYEKPQNFEGLISRPQFGKYLETRFKKYAQHEQVQHFQTVVLDLAVVDATTKEVIFEGKNKNCLYQLKTTNGWREDIYDAVFLALGHPAYADYYGLNGLKNYIDNPYPVQDKLKQFTNDDTIGIIGSGATGIDLMRFFATNYQLKKPLTYYVQEQGFYFANIPYEQKDFQFTFSMNWIEEQKAKHGGIIPFALILNTFLQDIQAEGVVVQEVYEKYKKGDLASIRQAIETKDQDLALIHAYNTQLIPFLPHLYNSLSGPDKIIYLEEYHQKLIFFKSRVPFQTFKWLLELVDTGKLRIVYGLTDIQPLDEGGFLVKAKQTETVDYLVNATGFDNHLLHASKHSPLIHHLFENNIIMPHLNGRYVLVDWPQAQVMNQKFGSMNNLFFFGLLMGGTHHENNDAQLTYQLARHSANWFMEQRKS